MKSLTILMLFSGALLLACQPAKPEPAAENTADTPAVEPTFQITTFESDSTGIDSLVLRDREVELVAVPMEASARQKPISDDEAKCLMKCKKPDGSYDLDCILLCPVSKRFSLKVATVATRQ